MVVHLLLVLFPSLTVSVRALCIVREFGHGAAALKYVHVTLPFALRVVGCSVTTAQLPTVSTIVHTSCTASGNALIGCPTLGGGTLTITGNKFSGNPLTINIGCSGGVTVDATFTQITCNFAGGAVGSALGDLTVTNSAGTSGNVGRSITYGNPIVTVARLLVVHHIATRDVPVIHHSS